MYRPNIAIDGPAGAGKSTVARQLAAALGYIYVDTGAMYRAVTLKAIQTGISLDDQSALGELARALTISFEQGPPGGSQRIYLDGSEVTEEIRSPLVTEKVSRVSAAPEVRLEMVRLQRALAVNGGVVMDGRDIGSYVLPDAEYKFFLTASIEERARRRYREMLEKGYPVNLASLQAEISERDRADSARDLAPLVKAADAEVIDSSRLAIGEVINLILERLKSGVYR